MRRSPALLFACAVMAFVVVVAFRPPAGDPASRLPERYKLADLIEVQQRSAATLRRDAARLRADVDAARTEMASRSGGSEERAELVSATSEVAGLVPVEGPGLKVTLNDSRLDEPPSGSNVNDLVIHSQDVQAAVNALWRSGAEAVSINGQRLVSTSAVLCVGNTLLLNGTVHSPPYVISAVGASKDRFEADRLVRRLKGDAATFGLVFSIERVNALELPAYRGSTKLSYARPVD